MQPHSRNAPPAPAYVGLPSQKTWVFVGGNDVDIVGVTGSIPVTPTIRSLISQALSLDAAKLSSGSTNLRRASA